MKPVIRTCECENPWIVRPVWDDKGRVISAKCARCKGVYVNERFMAEHVASAAQQETKETG